MTVFTASILSSTPKKPLSISETLIRSHQMETEGQLLVSIPSKYSTLGVHCVRQHSYKGKRHYFPKHRRAYHGQVQNLCPRQGQGKAFCKQLEAWKLVSKVESLFRCLHSILHFPFIFVASVIEGWRKERNRELRHTHAIGSRLKKAKET